MHLDVVTPTKKILDIDVEQMIVNTPEGEIGIFPHHEKLVTRVNPGEMVIKVNGKPQYFAIAGGFLEVNSNKVTVVADYAVPSEDIKVEKALEAKKKAEEILKQKKEGISEQDFATAQADLRRAVAQIQVAKKRRKEGKYTPQG